MEGEVDEEEEWDDDGVGVGEVEREVGENEGVWLVDAEEGTAGDEEKRDAFEKFLWDSFWDSFCCTRG